MKGEAIARGEVNELTNLNSKIGTREEHASCLTRPCTSKNGRMGTVFSGGILTLLLLTGCLPSHAVQIDRAELGTVTLAATQDGAL